MGGFLMKHADACEQSSLFNASAPLGEKKGKDTELIFRVFLW